MTLEKGKMRDKTLFRTKSTAREGVLFRQITVVLGIQPAVCKTKSVFLKSENHGTCPENS